MSGRLQASVIGRSLQWSAVHDAMLEGDGGWSRGCSGGVGRRGKCLSSSSLICHPKTMDSFFTFPLFSSLPPELRIQIWRDALPDQDRPALYPYKRGCWCPRWLSPSDRGNDPKLKPNIDLEFRYELLDDIQVELPLVFVNREARGIALAWALHQGINMCFCKDRQCHIFIRPFNPKLDALYIAPNRLYDFYAESSDRIFEPDLFAQNVNVAPVHSRFAIPETLLQAEDDLLREMFDEFLCLAMLFVIVNTPPEFTDNETKVQRQSGSSRTHRNSEWPSSGITTIAALTRRMATTSATKPSTGGSRRPAKGSFPGWSGTTSAGLKSGPSSLFEDEWYFL